MAFKIYASAALANPVVTEKQWGRVRTANKLAATPKFAEFNSKDYLLSHCTIVASVDTDPYTDYYITPSTTKYVNMNYDCWQRDLLSQSYRSFIGAENYVEHVQVPSLSKGKIIDAVLRDIEGETLYCDILVATDKKHKELVHKIRTGSINAMSMGCIASFTICTKCGNRASDEKELCPHVHLKGSTFMDERGTERIIAELCGHVDSPGSVRFIEASWVENPAFPGAVLRNILNPDDSKDPTTGVKFYANIPEVGLYNNEELGRMLFASENKSEEEGFIFSKSPKKDPGDEQDDRDLESGLDDMFGNKEERSEDASLEDDGEEINDGPPDEEGRYGKSKSRSKPKDYEMDWINDPTFLSNNSLLSF